MRFENNFEGILTVKSLDPNELRNGFRYLTILLFFSSLLASCTSSPNVTRTKTTTSPTADPDRAKIDNVLRWIDQASLNAQSLYAEGSLTASNEVTSQDAHFTLRAKRLGPNSNKKLAVRTDSLSVEVTGPFGISVARFLASPDQYYFYNALNGDAYHGATDAHSLEQLVQMRGVTLGMMQDALFGLAPGADLIDPQDSVMLLSVSADDHILFFQHNLGSTTTAIYLRGALPDGSEPITSAQLTIVRFARWNRILQSEEISHQKPDVAIRYDDPTLHDGIFLPRTIETSSGNNQLTIEYSTVRANQTDLTVKIKIPKS